MSARSPLFITCTIVTAVVIASLTAALQRVAPPLPAPSLEAHTAAHITPFTYQNCRDCHGDGVAKGDFDLDRFPTAESIRTHRDTWERALTNVRLGLMPPKDEPQPTPAARASFVSALDQLLHPIDPLRPDPGRVVLRRLNREEYRNTVHDLLGITFDPAENFPEDDSGYGFDHIGDVLTLSPLLFERYYAAARAISEAVIVDPRPASTTREVSASAWTGDGVLMTPGETTCTLTLPATGSYRVTLRTYEDRAGDEPARFALTINGRPLGEFAADGRRRSPRLLTLNLKLAQGENRFGVRYLNNFRRAATDGRPAQDRNLYVDGATVEGPLSFDPVALSPFQRSIIGAPLENESINGWIARVSRALASLLYRRPATDDEVASLVALVQLSQKRGEPIEVSWQLALQALLISPSFLFHGEPPGALEDPERNYPLSDYAIASRLASFLWSSAPDRRLLALAESGRLRARLPSEVKRLLADPKAARFVRNFAGQWLQLRNLPLREPDSKLFPQWDRALATSMEQETLRFFGDFLTNGQPISELITADWSFVDARLARFYGLPERPAATEPDGFMRTPLPPGRRAGLLTHASILTVTSYPNRTSPVLRGRFVLDKLLGTPPPPPPPNIPSLDEPVHTPSGANKPSVRMRLEQHRQNPSCISCHALMDPLGFALENYDALGAYRTTEEGAPIDSAGQLVSGEHVDSAESLARVLSTSQRSAFHRNVASTLLTYALGRGLDYYDRPTIDRIVETASRHGHTLPAYIEAVTASIAFQQRRGERPSGSPPPPAALARN